MALPENNSTIILIGNAENSQEFAVDIDSQLHCVAFKGKVGVPLQVLCNPDNTFTFKCNGDDENFGLYMTAVTEVPFETGVIFSGRYFSWTLRPVGTNFTMSVPGITDKFLTLMSLTDPDNQLQMKGAGSGKSQKWKFISGR